MKTNVLYYGDNLEILRHHIPDESVDLVYLDPPFNSQANYNVLFREESGERSVAQIKAFSDFWHWDSAAEETFKEIVETCPDKVATMVSALRNGIGDNDVMAYLVMMTLRLVELRRVLKATGSLYLHCDPTASHYLKVVMDAIFGPRNFVNEIVWRRSDAKGDTGQGARHFGRVNDALLLYAKSPEYRFNALFRELDPDYVERFYRYRDPDGRPYKLDNMLGPGGAAKGNPRYEVMGVARYWRYSREHMEELIRAGRVVQTKPGTVPMYKRYLDESKGTPLTTNWADISFIRGWSNEKLGYATQKPLALLERIVAASSNEGDVVLDPFCGCGTAVVAAHKLGRLWIGIDVTFLAVDVMRKRLCDSFKADFPTPKDVTVIGEPVDVAGAHALAAQDRYQFQWWALSLVNALPAGDERKKGADMGIDGVIGFVEEQGKAARVIVSVKSGHVSRPQISQLKGDIEREKAAIGLFVTLEPPTQPMRTEAVSAGFYHSALWDKDYPKVQILTIDDLLAGKQPLLPPSAGGAFAKAPKIAMEQGKQQQLIP